MSEESDEEFYPNRYHRHQTQSQAQLQSQSQEQQPKKRQLRPWDNGCTLEQHLARAERVLSVPSIVHNGITFKSDRFYLNQVHDHDDGETPQMRKQQDKTYEKRQSSASQPTHHENGFQRNNGSYNENEVNHCTCGSRRPPPLFPREDFVRSLDLEAAIFGTFSLDFPWLIETFPSLFGPTSTIPTLVLHGHKGLTPEKIIKELQSQAQSQQTSKKITSGSTKAKQQQVLEQEEMENKKLPHCNLDFHVPFSSPKRATNKDDDDYSSVLDGEDSSLMTQDDTYTSLLSTSHNSTLELHTTAAPPASLHKTQHNPATSLPARPSAMVMPATILSDVCCNVSDRVGTNTDGKKTSTSSLLGDHLHLTQIMSSWLPSYEDSTKVTREQNNNSQNLSQDNETKKTVRESKRGVHHPKFMLLFETSGDMIVLVSTANLTPTRTIEGTWMQRFHRNRSRSTTTTTVTSGDMPSNNFSSSVKSSSTSFFSSSSQTSTTTSSTTTALYHPNNSGMNDFGPVLVDFLKKLSFSARDNQMSVEHFLSKYLAINLDELSYQFHFEKAQVHLVPVVPGDWKGGSNRGQGKTGRGVNIDLDCSKQQRKRQRKQRQERQQQQQFVYGRQRVQYILSNRLSHVRLQPHKNDDRLIIQPTSFGSNWKRGELADVVRSYMCLEDGGNNNNKKSSTERPPHCGEDDDFWDESALLERMDIVWPSQEYMARTSSSDNKMRVNSNVQQMQRGIDGKNSGQEIRQDGQEQQQQHGSSYVFLSSQTFNSCDPNCLMRMGRYSNSIPKQHPNDTIPHFKSVARLCGGNSSAGGSRGASNLPHVLQRVPNKHLFYADEYLSWFLLTSSCLSHGAQGKRIKLSDMKSKISYGNFELGVLFTSKWQDDTNNSGRGSSSSSSSSTSRKNRHFNKRTKQRPSTTMRYKKGKNRIYCFHPHECSCPKIRGLNSHGQGDGSRYNHLFSSPIANIMIHLPIPYDLRPKMYVMEENENTSIDENNFVGDDGHKDDSNNHESSTDEAAAGKATEARTAVVQPVSSTTFVPGAIMEETPFFHEILSGSRCVGNMLMTPYGNKVLQETLAKKAQKQRKSK